MSKKRRGAYRLPILRAFARCCHRLVYHGYHGTGVENALHPGAQEYGVESEGDPEKPPETFWNLTMTGEVLISRGFSIDKVICKKGRQYGYSGHALSVGQDIGELVQSLPWRTNLDDLSVMIIQTPGGGSWTARHFQVSRRMGGCEFHCLISHSPGYRGVVAIEMLRLREQMQHLPQRNDDVDVMSKFFQMDDPDDRPRENDGYTGEGGDCGPAPGDHVWMIVLWALLFALTPTKTTSEIPRIKQAKRHYRRGPRASLSLRRRALAARPRRTQCNGR